MFQLKRVCSFVSLALILGATSVHAEDKKYSVTADFGGTFQDIDGGGLRFDGAKSLAYSLYADYQVDSQFGFGVGFTDYNVSKGELFKATSSINSTNVNYAAISEATSISLYTSFTENVTEDIQAVLKLGVASTEYQMVAEASIGNDVEIAKDRSAYLFLGLGANYKIDENFYLTASYTYTKADAKINEDFVTQDGSTEFSSSNMTLLAEKFAVGVKYLF